MNHLRITMKDPSRFRDPFGLNWPKYIAMQARDKEHYEKQKAALPPEALEFKLADPGYLEEVTHCQFLDNYFAELSATKYLATVVKNSPFEELKKCALFQIIDEQRHMEMDAEVLQRAGVPENEWLDRWREADTTYRFFQHVVSLEDPMEILLKANFLGETGAVTASFDVLAQWARRKGDPLSAINHEARLRDESRHSKTGWVLAKALIEDDAKNLAVIQEWQDEALKLWYVVSREGARKQWWDNFQNSYFRVAAPLGLRQPAA
ncbi:MAG: hypothetical protein HY651_03930 [Acidobacteria bacterium]|nr:hypothetical protein [Acidobacteriota bacterium]